MVAADRVGCWVFMSRTPLGTGRQSFVKYARVVSFRFTVSNVTLASNKWGHWERN
jgi:hypothetical protein